MTERSIPLLYLRPILQRRELLAANVSFVRDLRQSLTALGYQAEIVAPRPPWQSGIALFWLAALAPVGAWLLLADQAPAAIRKALVAGLFAAWLALPLWNILRARQLFALLAAVVFPLCAVLASRNVSSGVRRAAAAGLVAAAGGLVVSGLLGSWQFCLALWRFAGVKVAFLLPVGLLGLWAFSPLAGGGDWEEFKKWCQSQLAAPLRVWHVALGLVLAAILAVYLLRSGNTGLAPQWERTAREALEGIFGYRPRTKELLCYPLLVLAFSLKPSFWQRLCLPLGAIALVSTINSFAHAHTPLSASLVRSFWGLALGLCLGWLLTLLERKVIRHS